MQPAVHAQAKEPLDCCCIVHDMKLGYADGGTTRHSTANKKNSIDLQEAISLCPSRYDIHYSRNEMR